MSTEVHALVEHLFRHEAGRITSRLIRIHGTPCLTQAEDAVQFAMLQALRLWPYQGVPASPGAWLMRVAANRAIDLRRAEGHFDHDSVSLSTAVDADRPTGYRDEMDDEELCLMFVCCHPALPRASSTALTLKVLCGFGATEIARAFMTSPATIAQRLVRAKRLIRKQRIAFAVPGPEELPARLDAVLEVLYLLFAEGYAPSCGDRAVKDDCCADAIRLTGKLAAHPVTGQPACHALLALMLFQASRLHCRTDCAGELLLLAEQDRAQWDQTLVGAGLRHLALAGRGDRLTALHLQAEIAALHAVAPSFAQTEWARIRSLYDLLCGIQPTPVVWVNRAVAIAAIDGPDAGLDALAQAPQLPRGATHASVPMARGEFHRCRGDRSAAIRAFSSALRLARTEPERRLIARRLATLRDPEAETISVN